MGNVEVIATNTACALSAAPENLPVTKYAVITSITTGNFNQPTTWDCNCIPPSTSNIVIDSSHTVTLVAATTVNNLTINATGTLDNAAQIIYINGNYTINGVHTGTGASTWDRIYFDGDGTTLNGT